jgi:hypothetical protein
LRNMRDLNNNWDAPPQGRSSSGMVWLIGQMFFIPLRTLVYGMGMIVDAMRNLQMAGDRGMDVIAGGQSAGESPVAESQPAAETTDSNHPAATSGTEKLNEEAIHVDQTLNNDSIKLVRYKILSVKRGDERIVKDAGGEELVTDNMDAAAYTAWKIAEHCNKFQISDDDRKYLRVYFEVLETYPRQEFKYHEDQIKVLKEIRDNIGGAAAKV